jgi:Arc/MetJ-type ribon-helix-helix transcriptional regulator
MTMLSFRVSRSEAEEVQGWAERLGVRRSDVLREAVRRHLVRLASEHDALTWERMPLSENEKSIAEVADWGPAEDWSEWTDAAR